MAAIRTINFLPEVFKTETNQKFLNATLDQLVSQPDLRKVNAYVGRKFAPTFKSTDNYQPEPSTARQNYQLEPTVVVANPDENYSFVSTYIDLLNQIDHFGGITDKHSRLFESETYSFNGLFDFDKFVNFNQYYWLPDGPDTVQVYGSGVDTSAVYTVTRDSATGSYHFSGYGTTANPSVRLAHGGTYQFIVNQPGYPFWIQSALGTSGAKPNQTNLSSRDVLGVQNNGIDVGIITFTVPASTSQDFYLQMPLAGSADLSCNLSYTQIQGQPLASIISLYGGIDGIQSQLSDKTLVFTNRDIDSSKWTVDGVTVPASQRRNIWNINVDNNGIVNLVSAVTVSNNERVYIKSGVSSAEYTYFLDPDSTTYSQVPDITAPLPILYYQDEKNPVLAGEFRMLEPTNSTINVDDEIIGKPTYTNKSTGVEFTNGLKIQFDSSITPQSYFKTDYTSYTAWLEDATRYGATKITGDDTSSVAYRGTEVTAVWTGTSGERYHTYYVEGVGTAIRLVLDTNLQTPEPYAVNGINSPDYLTINRGSRDLNPWSRSNRWFHIDVITATANYNNTVPLFDQAQRANRPIIEFEADLQLFNFGRVAKEPIDILDFTVDDARNQVELARVYSDTTNYVKNNGVLYNGYVYKALNGTALSPLLGVNPTDTDNWQKVIPYKNGLRVVFANDFDPTVQNRIFVLSINVIAGQPTLTMTEASDYQVTTNNNLIVLQGDNTGIEYYYTGSQWIAGQQKNGINQAPLFDIIDINGYRLSDTSKYPNSTFAGTTIFSYQHGTGSNDSVLGFPLSYRNFNQIGDIQFDNTFDSDTFDYTGSVGTTVTAKVNSGVLQQNADLTNYKIRNIWTKNVEKSKQFQILSGIYNGVNSYFEIDVSAEMTLSVPNFRVYRNNKILAATQYSVVTVGIRTFVQVTDPALTLNDRIDILIYSTNASTLGYYEVPQNLDLNTENTAFTSLTLGQLRNHLVTMVNNSNQIIGSVPGESNLRDVSIKQQGGSIIQHASPVIYSELFLVDEDANFMKGIELARHEYSKIKNKFLELSMSMNNIDRNNIPGTTDAILKTINAVKNKSFAWYYSDMVPYGDIKNVITYTVLSSNIVDYEISGIFSDTTLSSQAILVYINGSQLVKGRDYVFDTTRAGITFSIPLTIGDVITINEYSNTDGNYIPETPTKLGLYPKFTPSIYLDDTYQTPTLVIQGHDGSITPAFGDFRDELLLELELRIYNNIKINYDKNIFDVYNYLPGKFRDTDYSVTEFNKLLTRSFLQWAGNNRVDFTNNTFFNATNPWTWNYKRFTDSIDKAPSLGGWRAIFKHLYDTDRPHTHPWEMVGFTEQPTWWEARYGAAPYTGGNLVLWGDMSKGYIHAGSRAGYDTRFIRPGLLNIIPVDDHGALRPPSEFAVTNFNSNDANGSFAVGDIGPVESAWRRSSDYPYAVQQALALSHPAFYFGSLMDVGRYYKNTDLDQYVLADSLQRITPTTIVLNGDTTTSTIGRAAGYINWISEYLRNRGIDPISKVSHYLKNANVQLAYKMGGYTDKSFLEVLAEQSSPTSTNSGVVVPKENYSIELNKSTPVSTVVYSAVIIEKSQNGYTVSGYNTSNPYFTIIPSLANNNAYSISVLNENGVIYKDFQKYKVTVPYGFEFTNKQQVVDFLVSYERYLRANGISMTEFDGDLEQQRDFKLSVKEFLMWSQQGWETGNILIVSPILNKLVVNTTSGVVDEIQNYPGGTRLLDANFNFIKSNQFTVVRDGNRFSVTANYGQTIALAVLDVVEYEHVIIFDNVTVFNDIIYKPELGNRQYRLKLVGKKTGSWTGNLNPPGFIYNSPNIDQWQSGVDYARGSLVTYKSQYYTAIDNLIAAVEFSPSSWKRLSSNEIKSGLLPNFSYSAEKFNRFNDIDNPEEAGSFDQYSTGSIGFRPRDYLTNFGVDNATQAKFYQGFIREKGTINAVNAFTAAGFNGVTSTINLYEEWAMRVGEYGALENNKFAEVTLVEGQFVGDPTTFTLLPSDNAVAEDKIIGIKPSDLYKGNSSSYTGSIYSNRDNTSIYENDILTAGYVNANDIDTTIFDLSKYAELNNQLAEIGVGYKIWTAKDFAGNWNVYRVSETDISVTNLKYNVDNIGTITMNGAHSFVEGDLVVIKSFDSRVDGFYQVYSVNDVYSVSVVIPANLEAIKNVNSIDSFGPIYKLQSMRVTSTTDVVAISPKQGWSDADKLWVDNDENNTWAVYNKTSPWQANLDAFNTSMVMDANSYIASSGFGTVVTINSAGTFAAAGMPNVMNGNVIAFVANVSNNNTLTKVANIGVTDSVTKFGSSLDSAGNLLYVGAPGNGSNTGKVYVYQFDGDHTFTKIQTLTNGGVPGELYGQSISASADGSWLFVGAPGSREGNVYVYHGNATSYYTLANTISGNSYISSNATTSSQFGLTVKATSDASQVIIGAPYEKVGNVVSSAGAVYVFDRSIETFIATGATSYTTEYPVYAANVKVTVNGITKAYTTDYTVSGSTVTFVTAPVVGSHINVDTNKIRLLKKLTAPTLTSGAMFGITAHISGDDSEIYVASPEYSEAGYHSGIVYRFVNDGAAYGTVTGTVVNPTVTVGHTIHLNGVKVTFGANAVGSPVGNISSIVSNINSANIPGVTATISGMTVGGAQYGQLQLNSDVVVAGQRLLVAPGTGTALTDLGIDVYTIAQTIKHPNADEVNQFGSCITSSIDGKTLVISANGGTTYNRLTLDQDTTILDTGSTEFVDGIRDAGIVYVYGLVGAALSGNVQDQYVLTQKLENYRVTSEDQFGFSLALNSDTLLVGAPGDSNNYTIDPVTNDITYIPDAGTFYTYENMSGNIGWDILRSESPKVDIDSVTRLYLYNKDTNSILTNLDHIDPAKGKILGAAEQDIDFKTVYDPAIYNVASSTNINLATNVDFHWGKDQVGKTWWDLNAVRYIDYEQGDLTYRAGNWGAMFPGSDIAVYEWVESDSLPSAYAGDGTPKHPDNSAYTVQNYVDHATKIIRSKYYFWVRNKTSVNTDHTYRSSTISTLEDMISNPAAQGIPYATVLRNDTISLHNISGMISANTTALHIDYDTIKNTNIIHSEYQLVQEGNSNSVIPERIIKKIKDSLAGQDQVGNAVPDPMLAVQDRIGINIRPRQTVFVNRLLAVKNWVNYVNNILITTPVVEEFNIDSLYSAEALPAIEDYNISVANKVELGYIEIELYDVGYVALVLSDESLNGIWSLYTLQLIDGAKTFVLTRQQSYNTPFYWSTVDWNDTSYDPTTNPTYVVNSTIDLQKISLVSGETVKVLNNGRGQNTVYRRNASGTNDIVSIQNGTIQLNSNLYAAETSAGQEIRIIFDTLENYIFTDTLSSNFNKMFFFLVNYVLSEQKSVDWIFKTSFVSVLHQLRKLEQFPNYIKDNQTYYESYINEIKPYRTSLREYLLDYQALDTFRGDISDFDIPSSYNSTTETYRSPDGSLSSDEFNLSTLPQYSQWYANHKLSIEEVIVANSGTGYFITPNVTVVGGGGSGAVVEAVIDTASNSISKFNVVKSGSGYTSTPLIVINGTGTGATAYPRLANKHFIESVPTTVLTAADPILITAGNIITQPNTGAIGTASNSILSTKVLTLNTSANVYVGNVIAQYYTGAYGTVSSASTNDQIELVNVVGTFNTSGNTFIYRDKANLHAKVNSVTSGTTGLDIILTGVSGSFNTTDYIFSDSANLETTAQTINSFTAFENKSYNTVRNISTSIKFDRTAYESAVTQWLPATNYNAGDVVGYNGTAYMAEVDVTSTATLKLNGNITVAAGEYIIQPGTTGNAQVVTSVTDDSLINLVNVTGTYVRRDGNISIVHTNGSITNTTVTPLTINNIFDVSKYSVIDASSLVTAGDRVFAYYQPGPGMPSRNLKKLFAGTDYPGVQIEGVNYADSTATLTSAVISTWSNTSVIHSGNVQVTDFSTQGYAVGAPIRVVNNDTTEYYDLQIGDISSDTILIVGTVPSITEGANVSLVYYNYNNPTFLDTTISSSYLDSALGTRPEDINIDGGAYIDTYNSHAPEELIPGIVYDSLKMDVYTKIKSNTQTVGFRITQNMQSNAWSRSADLRNYAVFPKYYKIDGSTETTLAANLLITDSNIYVTDSTVLLNPNPELKIPGVIYINGEKIVYWQKDDTENRLSQLRRATDGTGAPLVHETTTVDPVTGLLTATKVTGITDLQLLPQGNTSSTMAHKITWLNPNPIVSQYNLVDNFGTQIDDNLGNDIISPAVDSKGFMQLTTPVSVVAGDTITQPSTGVTATVYETSTDSNTITIWAANIAGGQFATIIPDTTSNTYIFNNGGNLHTKLSTISYNVVDGLGLEGSRTPQALFIKGSF